MPLENTHTARQIDPTDCQRIRQGVDAFGPGVTVQWCVRPGKPVAVQSIHFDSKRFSADAARKWLKDHDYSEANFEPAKPDNAGAAVQVVDIAAEGLPPLLRIDAAAGSLELQAAAGDGTSRKRSFQATAYTGAAMRLDGYPAPVVIDLAGMKVPAARFPMLRQHDPERIVGYADASEITAQRVKLSGHLAGVTTAGQEALALADSGFPWQLSVGADVGKMEFVPKDSTAKANGRNFDGPVYVARATSLRECSLVPMGADAGTSATVASAAATEPPAPDVMPPTGKTD